MFKEIVSQPFNAEVVHYSTQCRVDKNKLITIDSVTIQINNRTGDNYGNILIPYSATENLSRLDAWIEDRNGIRKQSLNKKDIIDKSAISSISLYEDHFVKSFQLKYNQYPYRISFTYQKSFQDFIEIAHWSPAIYPDLPTRNASLTVFLPGHYKFRTFDFQVPDHQIDSTGETIVIHYDAEYNGPVKDEVFAQEADYTPYVIVAPTYFHYGIDGCLRDWVSYGNWQNSLSADMDELPENEKIIVDNLIQGQSDPKEMTRILYHYLQDHTRYIDVSIGIGGFKTYPASYVAKNKYGDCKALTNYMKALLNHAGIPSYFVYVYADDQPIRLLPDYAGPQFNHVILAVPVGTDTIWLENTSNVNPFGYLGTFTQNRYGFIVNENESRLIHIPALKAEENIVARKLVIEPDIPGQAKLYMSEDSRGEQFELFNLLNTGFDQYEKDILIREYMPFQNYEVQDWELIKINRDTPRITLHANLTLFDFVKVLGNDFYMDGSSLQLPRFMKPSERTLPLELPYPICLSDSIIYKIPADYELKKLPETITDITRFGTFEMSGKTIDGSVYIIKKLVLIGGNYSLETYPDFYDFIQDVREMEGQKIIIQRRN